MAEELSGIVTQAELEKHWESKNLLTREIIDIKKHYPNATDNDALKFIDKKNVVFVKETHGNHGDEACIAYLKELGCFCAQGENRREALDDLLYQLEIILPFEQDHVRWLNVIEMYETLKKETEGDIDDVIRQICLKYSIKDNLNYDIRDNDIFV